MSQLGNMGLDFSPENLFIELLMSDDQHIYWSATREVFLSAGIERVKLVCVCTTYHLMVLYA